MIDSINVVSRQNSMMIFDVLTRFGYNTQIVNGLSFITS